MRTTENLLLDCCLLAGRIMAESGSEAYRVEDTMQRIASNAGDSTSKSYVTSTGLFINLKEKNLTGLDHVQKRNINLEKVDAVNALSRKFAQGCISLEELYEQLVLVESDAISFPLPLQVVAAGIASSSLMMIFGGKYSDLLVACIVGMLGFYASYLADEHLNVRYLNYLIASFVVTFSSYVAWRMNLASNVDSIIIGGIMPLVPGVAITNSFRDILAGHLLSGVVRGVEAIFIAGTIGVGTVVAFRLLGIGG